MNATEKKLYDYNYILLFGLGLRDLYSPDGNRDKLRKVIEERMPFIKKVIMDYVPEFDARERDNPKFCVNSMCGANRAKSIMESADLSACLHVNNITPVRLEVKDV